MTKGKLLYALALCILLTLASAPAFADITLLGDPACVTPSSTCYAYTFQVFEPTAFSFLEVEIVPPPTGSLASPAIVGFLPSPTNWAQTAGSPTTAVAAGGPSTVVEFNVQLVTPIPNGTLLDVLVAKGPNEFDLTGYGVQYIYESSIDSFTPNTALAPAGAIGSPTQQQALPDVPEAGTLLLLATMIASVAGALKLKSA